MKQLLQQLRNGRLSLETVPPPRLLPGGVIVRTAASLISAGTERAGLELARKNLLQKARARPDLVKKVLAKARTEGWRSALDAVDSRLDKPVGMGYSASGVVEEVGREVSGLEPGQRVAIAGAGYANHAEVCFVPRNLVASLLEGVTLEDAAYTTVASIALQGVRLARPELGDNVGVIGLGLVGSIVGQLLKANGCRVIGFDLDQSRIDRAMALSMDAGVCIPRDDPGQAVAEFTNGRGLDHVLITAASKGNEPIELAAEVARARGQIVVVGTVDMKVPRRPFYDKELDLKVSKSYGPGRYDPSYEEGGIDYPYEYVRWTEQRNMQAVLELMAGKQLDVGALTTHRFPFAEALTAYSLIEGGEEKHLGVVLTYDSEAVVEPVVELRPERQARSRDRLRVGFVGAGGYATAHLLPRVGKREDVELAGLATATGSSARSTGEKYGFAFCTTRVSEVLEAEDVDAVFIATRNSTHCEYASRALAAGKHVFVEKPMVVDEGQLIEIAAAFKQAQREDPAVLVVGLNRRFAPLTLKLLEVLPPGTARQMHYRVNAGPMPADFWWYDASEGGGALVGEMCHFLDLLMHIAGEEPVRVYAQALVPSAKVGGREDDLSITVTFAGGSVGTLTYNTVGDKVASKERLEVFGGGAVLELEDFRELRITRGGRSKVERLRRQDKGQAGLVEATIQAFRGLAVPPIPFAQLETTMVSVLAARESLRTASAIDLGRYRQALERERPSGQIEVS